METLDTLYVCYAELKMAGRTDQEIKYLDAAIVKDPCIADWVDRMLTEQRNMRDRLKRMVLGE